MHAYDERVIEISRDGYQYFEILWAVLRNVLNGRWAKPMYEAEIKLGEEVQKEESEYDR